MSAFSPPIKKTKTKDKQTAPAAQNDNLQNETNKKKNTFSKDPNDDDDDEP